MSDLISVIVPAYNVEKYIRYCLNSLKNQSYSNIEVIMVDDGSKDSTGVICDEFAAKYVNFQVIHKSNEGLGFARNTGIQHAHGKYITFVDSDDWIDENLLQTLYDGISMHSVDMCKSGFDRVNDAGQTISSRIYETKIYDGKLAKDDLFPRMIGSSPVAHDSIEMCVCGAIYKLEIIQKYSIKFLSERVLISEDLVFNMDYLQHSNGASTIAYSGYMYRLNNNSLTTSYRKDRFEACRYFYLEMKNRLESYGYNEETLLRLNRAFFIYLRMCISQERKNISGLPSKKSINNIHSICSDIVVRTAIENYPIKKIGFEQAFFLRLILNNMSLVLYILAFIGIV